MPFTFNAVELCVVTINEKPWIREKEVCRTLNYKRNYANIVLRKTRPKSIKWVVCFLRLCLWTGQKTHKNTTSASMRKECMSFCIQVNSLRQNNLGSIVVTWCFLMFGNSIQTKSRKIPNKPLKKKMQHLHCSLMIYKTMKIRFKPSNMKTWHCKHKEMYINPRYKGVKAPLSILGHNK